MRGKQTKLGGGQIDFIIVGQGIAGSLLGLKLMERGCTIAILDSPLLPSSSSVAAGLYNPITGRGMVKTWLCDAIFNEIDKFYNGIQDILRTPIYHPQEIYRPFFSLEERKIWVNRKYNPDYLPFIKKIVEKPMQDDLVNNPYGGIILRKTGYVDVAQLIKSSRGYFRNLKVFHEELFQYKLLDYEGSLVKYKDFIGKKIVFCEGSEVVNNPFFKNLKFKLVKGEILTLNADRLPRHIINRGVFASPRKGKLLVGSNYDHQDMSWQPTGKARAEILTKLKKILRINYEFDDQRAGLRAATFDRRPYLGQSFINEKLYIFNGLGAKGITLSSFFISQMVDVLLIGKPLPKEVHLNR